MSAIGAVAGRLDFIWQQGATFLHQVTYKSGGTAVDLTGASAAMQVRESPDSATILATVTATVEAPATDGIITLSATPAETAALDQSGVYDLEITYSDGSVDRILEGRIKLSPQVTA